MEKEKENRITRRDILKGLASLPVFGVFIYKLLKKKSLDNFKRDEILSEFEFDKSTPAVLPKTTSKTKGELIRLGIIGFGARGEQLARSAGFAHPEWIKNKKLAAQKNKLDKSLEDWLSQDDLNVAITGICDVFDMRADKAKEIASFGIQPNGEPG